jgi:hypothetical protein
MTTELSQEEQCERDDKEAAEQEVDNLLQRFSDNNVCPFIAILVLANTVASLGADIMGPADTISMLTGHIERLRRGMHEDTVH